MSDEQWLRRGLADAVPDPPLNPRRAPAAVERARRARRRTAAAVGGACLVVAAIAVVPALAGDDPAAGPADTPAVSPTGAPACPPAPRPFSIAEVDPPAFGELDRADPDAPATVPEGASSVRLCQGAGTQSFDVPVDALVTDVDLMVDAVNGLQEVSGDLGDCGVDDGIGYRLSFGYPGGGTFVVSARLYDCGIVVVGSSERLGAHALWDHFSDRLSAQRAVVEPPTAPELPADACVTMPRRAPVAVIEDLAVAAVCVDERGSTRQAEIPAADLELLLADLGENQVRMRCRTSSELSLRIAGLTGWGDFVQVDNSCGMYHLGDGVAWRPGRPAQQVLDRLAEEAR